MHLSNANKALLITILLSSSVVLMAFNLHLKKKNKLAAETFYEVLPEDYVLEEQQQDLDEILESLDKVLATNKAFNETKTYEKLDDNEFEETMEKLKNRNADSDDDSEQKSYEPAEEVNDANFDEINDIISKRSQKNRGSEGANRNSTMSYSLIDRDLLNNPTPIYLCERGGKIVINITVNSDGVVQDASYNAAASSSDNGCLIDHAIEYAQAAQFSTDLAKESQIGTITFFFRGKL